MFIKQEEDVSSKSIHESLQCNFCLELFKDPKQLACTHVFCANCVQQLIDSSVQSFDYSTTIKCPSCNERTRVPKEGLKTAHIIKSLVEKIQSDTAEEPTQGYCSICLWKKPDGELHFCKTCFPNNTELSYKSFFCGACGWKKHNGHSSICLADIVTPKNLDLAKEHLKKEVDECQQVVENTKEGLKSADSACASLFNVIGKIYELFQQKTLEVKNTCEEIENKILLNSFYKMEMLDDGIADVATTKTKIQECYKEFIKLQLTAKDCFHTLSKSAEMHLKSFSDLLTQVSEPEIKQEKVSAEPVSNKPSKKSTSSSSSRSSSSSSPEKGRRSSSSCNFRKANYKLKNFIKFAKELYPNQEITKSIASSVIELIKGYRVVTNYMEEKNCYFTLDNLTLRSADQVKFFGKQGNLTVADYFADNFFCLQYPHIPCAIYENRHNGKSRTFFYPLEAISVLTDGYNVKDVPYSNSNHETSNYKQPRNRSTVSKRKADDDFFTRMAREKDKKRK